MIFSGAVGVMDCFCDNGVDLQYEVVIHWQMSSRMMSKGIPRF